MRMLFKIINKRWLEANKLIYLGILFAFLFWIVEFFLHYYAEQNYNLFQSFSWLHSHEIGVRLIVVSLFIIYGIYMQRFLNARVKAEAENERVLAELNQIFQTAGDGLRVIDEDFNVIRRSGAYLDLCGRRHPCDWKEKCFDEFPGDMCGTDDCPLRRIMRGEKRVNLDVRKKQADGSIVPCYETATPFFARDGELIGIVESFKDATLLKRYEEDLKKSQDRALAFFKGNPVPCYIWKKLDNDFILDNYNDAAYEITKGKIFDLIGIRFSRFYKDNPSFAGDIRACFEEKRPIRREIHYTFKSSSDEKDFIIIYAYISPDSVLVHMQDITIRKKFEEKILDLSKFPSENSNPVLRLDKDSRLLYINPSALCLLKDEGKSEEDFLDILPAHINVLIKVALRLKLSLADLEVGIGTKFFSYSLAPLSESGYVNLYGQDITRRKKAEELLKADKNGLKKTVDKKEAELLETTRRLEDTKRFSDLGVLAATIAHELRNPLGVIRSAVYNINRKNSNPALGSHLANIEKKVYESDQIIRNLLSYSKVSAPHFAQVSILKILDECVVHCVEKYAEWKVEIRRDITAGVDMIDADPVHVTELFCNILDNAYQSFPQKEGIIKITADYISERDEIRIAIEDNGRGVEGEDLKKIFEPFFTKRQSGIGLGLTVCEQVVRLHGGAIEIKSVPYKGTCVIMTLPVRAKNREHEK